MNKEKCVIALIDDALNMRHLQNTAVREWYEVTEDDICRKRTEAETYTHGTLCARVLEEYSSGYELIAIRIMEDNKTPCSVKRLQMALELCCELKVDIISMSVGTAVLSDNGLLEPVIRKLHEKSIWMVAAQDNRGYITLPASYPQVVGVRCDRRGELEPGTFSCQQDDRLGIQITANYHFETKDYLPLTDPSNSLAVPMITGKICNYIRDGSRTSEKVFERLETDSSNMILKEVEKTDDRECMLPVIRLSGNWSADFRQRLLDRMKQEGYEAILLTNRKAVMDARIQNLSPRDLRNALVLAEQHTSADCIFTDRGEDYSADLEIRFGTDGIFLFWEGGEKKITTAEQEDSIDRMVQSIIATLS